MPDLKSLTVERFQACLEQRFELDAGEESALLTLVLVEVNAHGAVKNGRQPFSLVFRGPVEPVLPQRIYPLHNATLGDLGLFLVPVGPDNQGMCYEAVFT